MRTPSSPYYSPFTGNRAHGNRDDVWDRNPASLSNIPLLMTALVAILATGGPTYSFGVYASTLKRDLDLTQSQLETLGAASFGAGVISWIPGWCVDIWGSRSALVAGGCGQAIGFTLYWLVSRFFHAVIPADMIVTVLCVCSVMIFTSNNLVIGGVFKAIVVSCRLRTKGKAVGAAKAYLGLGAGVYSSLFHLLWNQQNHNVEADDGTQLSGRSDLDFLGFSAVLAIVAIALPSVLALPTKEAMDKDDGIKDESTIQHYNIIYSGLAALGTLVMGSSLVTLFELTAPTSTNNDSMDDKQYMGNESDIPTHTMIPKWVHALVIIIAWLGPILALWGIPTQSNQRTEFRKSQSVLRRKVRKAMEGTANIGEHMRLIPPGSKGIAATRYHNDTQSEVQNEEEAMVVCETPQPVIDRTLTEMLQMPIAWLFLGSSTILVGAGTMLTINMGQMVQALGFPPMTASACLALFSVSQAIARVGSGVISEAALQWDTSIFGLVKGVPRTAFLVFSCAFAVFGHALLAASCQSASLSLFVTGIVLMGISFGGLWPLMVLIMGDLFGTTNHGANYMFADGFTCAVGTLSVAKYLTQSRYESELALQRDSSTNSESVIETICLGGDCFQSTHLIISSLCLISFISSIVLLYSTQTSYGILKQ